MATERLTVSVPAATAKRIRRAAGQKRSISEWVADAATRTAKDVVDGHIVLLARERNWPVLTSDEADLRAIDARVELLRV